MRLLLRWQSSDAGVMIYKTADVHPDIRRFFFPLQQIRQRFNSTSAKDRPGSSVFDTKGMKYLVHVRKLKKPPDRDG